MLLCYALLGVLAITSVVAAPTGPASTPESLEFPLGFTSMFHRVKPGTEAHLYEKDLDDIIKFKMIEGVLNVAYMRAPRVLQDKETDQFLRWCMDEEGPRKAYEYFAKDAHYVPVNRLLLANGYNFLAGYWVDSGQLVGVSRFLRRFENCLITPYRNLRPSGFTQYTTK